MRLEVYCMCLLGFLGEGLLTIKGHYVEFSVTTLLGGSRRSHSGIYWEISGWVLSLVSEH